MEWRGASTLTVNPDERKVVVDSGASVHMISKMYLTVITANTSIDTTEEARDYVNDILDMFVAVQLVEDPPAELSLANSAKKMGFPTRGRRKNIESY